MFRYLKNKNGESSMDTAIALIISVVIGGMVLALIIGLTNNKVIPSFKDSFKKQQSTSTVYSDISSTSSDATYGKGDIDKNGEIDERDLKYLERHLDKWTDYDEIDSTLADINEDGTVDKNDLTALKSLVYDTSFSDKTYISGTMESVGDFGDDVLTVKTLRPGKYKLTFDLSNYYMYYGLPHGYLYVLKEIKYNDNSLMSSGHRIDVSNPEIVISNDFSYSAGLSSYELRFNVKKTIKDAKIVIQCKDPDGWKNFENYKLERLD